MDGDLIGLRCMFSPEAAALIGVRPQTLRIWRMKGCGPAYVRLGDTPGARVAYRLSDLKAWLDSRSFGSTAEEAQQTA